MRCPFCEFEGSRDTVHGHMVQAHADAVETWTIGNGRMRYRIACPQCGATHEARVKPRGRDPEFLETFSREIRLVAFDMLINHIVAEHTATMAIEQEPGSER